MKKTFFSIFVVVMCGLSYFLWHKASLANDGSEKPAAAAPAPAPEVLVTTLVTQRVALTSELPGRTAVYQVAEIRPQVGGIIQKRSFTEGAEVKTGQLLYQIDPATYEVAVARASAALAKYKAELEPARLKAARYEDLIHAKAVSQQDYDEVQAALALAKANVASAQAEVEATRIDLQRTRVVAPISGRIGRSAVTPGALVTANQAQAMATVQQLDPIYVDLTQSNMELLRLKRALEDGTMQSAGDASTTVRLILEDGSAYVHNGTLQLAEASVDQSTGSVTLRAVFPNPKRELLPGMYVRAFIEEGVLPDAICVPQQAVLRDAAGNAQVMIVDEADTVTVRPVVLDRAVGGDWVVREGVGVGDRVLIEGLQKVRPGAQVRIAQPTN